MARAVKGSVQPGYEAIADAFARITPEEGPGAAFAAVVDGRTVVDVYAGRRTTGGDPWRPDTPTVIFSGTKGVVAVAVLVLVERGVIDLAATVASVWPAFAVGGKEAVTIGDVLAHTSGIPGLRTPLTLSTLGDPSTLFGLLAAEVPFVPFTTPSYHAVTFGWLVDAIVRRVDGRSIARVVADDVAGPLGLDLWIGAPPDVAARVGRLVRAPGYTLSALSSDGYDRRLDWVYGALTAELDWSSEELLSLEVPAANGVATALAMARLYGCLARGGELDGTRVLRPETVALGRAERSRGLDPLTNRPLRFGVGFELDGTPSPLGDVPDAFGHTGAGGSTHGAWPSRRTGFSLVVTEMRSSSVDERGATLLEALRKVVDRA